MTFLEKVMIFASPQFAKGGEIVFVVVLILHILVIHNSTIFFLLGSK